MFVPGPPNVRSALARVTSAVSARAAGGSVVTKPSKTGHTLTVDIIMVILLAGASVPGAPTVMAGLRAAGGDVRGSRGRAGARSATATARWPTYTSRVIFNIYLHMSLFSHMKSFI